MSVISSHARAKVVDATIQLLRLRLAPWSLSLPIVSYDEGGVDMPKPPRVVVMCPSCVPIIDPSCGIFQAEVLVRFVSPIREQSKEERDGIQAALEAVAYQEPAARLSEVPAFHCYGFVPLGSGVRARDEDKVIEYETRWRYDCMPRDNA